MELFHKIWMKIQSLVRDNESLLVVQEIHQKLMKSFGKRTDPSDWNSGDEMAFYNFCVKSWGLEEPIYFENSFEDPCKKVLVQPNSRHPKTLQFLRRREEMKKLEDLKMAEVARGLYDRRVTWADYVRFGDELAYVLLKNDIKEGKYYKCLAGAVYTPGNFYVNLAYGWNNLEKMMGDMQ